MDLVIKHGMIVNADQTIAADVGIKDGKIVCVGQTLEAPGARSIDASGK